jgi:hypothetical protein
MRVGRASNGAALNVMIEYSVALQEYWNGEVSIDPLPINTDR